MWAIAAIIVIGLFNFMGPKHTGGFAIAAAVGMMLITVTITVFAIFGPSRIHWLELPHRIPSLRESFAEPFGLWIAFVSIVLALSGVEAIANLTGVMVKPVAHTARKAIWVVAVEVALFNLLLAVAMLAIYPLDRKAHENDMLAFLSFHYIGYWAEWAVRILGGLLLLSATNTALTDMISVQYLMARDGELPQFLVKLNRFGVPWIPALIAAGVPTLVLIISHDLTSLAALYAIGVIGAVAINVTLCALHPRLRRLHRKGPMMVLGLVLLAIWVVSPFVALLWASIVSKGWSVLTRVTLLGVMLVVPLSSLAVYVADAIWPRTSPGPFVFIPVPPASWLFSALVVLAAALISGTRSRRADGA